MFYGFRVKKEINNCNECPFYGINSHEDECCLLDLYLNDDYHTWYDAEKKPDWCELEKFRYY